MAKIETDWIDDKDMPPDDGYSATSAVVRDRIMFPYIHLSLDDLFGDGYFYTDYCIGGGGHWVVVKAEDREKFVDAFCAEFRKRVENKLIGKSSEYLS